MVVSRRVLVVVGLAVALALAIPATASAAYDFRSTYSFNGKNADAFTSAINPDGSSTDVGIWAGYATSRSNGTDSKPQKINENSANVWITSFAPATRRKVAVYREINGFGPATFTIDRKLTAATLSFTCLADVYEWYGTPPNATPGMWREPDAISTKPITVSAMWTGYGGLGKQMWVSKSSGDGFFSIDRSNSTYRNATASGSVVADDGTVYFDGAFDQGTLYDTVGGGSFRFNEVPF